MGLRQSGSVLRCGDRAIRLHHATHVFRTRRGLYVWRDASRKPALAGQVEFFVVFFSAVVGSSDVGVLALTLRSTRTAQKRAAG